MRYYIYKVPGLTQSSLESRLNTTSRIRTTNCGLQHIQTQIQLTCNFYLYIHENEIHHWILVTPLPRDAHTLKHAH